MLVDERGRLRVMTFRIGSSHRLESLLERLGHLLEELICIGGRMAGLMSISGCGWYGSGSGCRALGRSG